MSRESAARSDSIWNPGAMNNKILSNAFILFYRNEHTKQFSCDIEFSFVYSNSRMR